jgi:flagellar hook assembly protein FlgD
MGVEEESCNNQSQRLCLKQNCPNPFNSSTSIRYSVIRAGYVELKIYDLAGQLVKTLVNKEQKAGTYTIKWDGRDDNKNHLPSGIYFIKLSDNNLLETRKVIFVR